MRANEEKQQILEPLIESVFASDLERGLLFWRTRPREHFQTEQAWGRWNTLFSGKEAGGFSEVVKYRMLKVCGHSFYVHRILWRMATGCWPTEFIDHINGDKTDNRIANLREVSRTENQRNRAQGGANTSGRVGVYLDKRSGKWEARILVGKVQRHLGYFTDFDEAVRRRKQAERDQGFHPNHGRLV